jgi:hypothetical protein
LLINASVAASRTAPAANRIFCDDVFIGCK